MGQSGRLETKNDALIDQVIKDPLYKITKDGIIYTKLTENGQGVQKEWREAGHEKYDDGYIRFRYKGVYLFAHRVVYRKFKGPLKKDLTVRHLDDNPKNNKPKNLKLDPHAANNKDKWEDYYKKKKASIVSKVLQKLKDI